MRSLAAMPGDRRDAVTFYACFRELDGRLMADRDDAVNSARRSFATLLDAMSRAIPEATRQDPSSLLLPDQDGFLSFPYETAASLFISGSPTSRATVSSKLDGPDGPPREIDLGGPELAPAVGMDDTEGDVEWLDPMDLPEGHRSDDGCDHGPPGVPFHSRIKKDGEAWFFALTPSDRRDLVLQRDFARAVEGWATAWTGKSPSRKQLPAILREYEKLQRRHGQ